MNKFFSNITKTIIPFIVNLIVFIILLFITLGLAISEMTSAFDVIITIVFTLLTLISFPAFDLLLAKKTKWKKIRIIRWAIIFLSIILLYVVGRKGIMSELGFALYVIVVIVAAIMINIAKEKAPERAQKEWELEEEKYAKVICKLPSDLVKKMYHLLKQSALRISSAVPNNYPDEFMKIFVATKNVIDSQSYGTITNDQHRKIANILDKDLTFIVNEFIPSANQALSNLADSDSLGFDLITNSASDAMLYTAMNARSKVKGNNRRLREYNDMLDRKFVGIIEEIKEIV